MSPRAATAMQRTTAHALVRQSPTGDIFDRIQQTHDSIARYDSLASRLKGLDTIIPPVAYPKGAALFMEGQEASGIFAVCSGQVKLSTSSHEGKAIILRIAEAGELIGLPATLSGKPYEVTAIVSEQARATFIPRAAFLRFMSANPAAVVQVAQLLMNNHYASHEGATT